MPLYPTPSPTTAERLDAVVTWVGKAGLFSRLFLCIKNEVQMVAGGWHAQTHT